MEGVVRLVFGCLAKCPQYEPMGRAFSDDLRTRIGVADERGEGSCRVLAKRFGVSWEYVRKVRQQRRKNNSSARRPQSRYGVPSRISEADCRIDIPWGTSVATQFAAQPSGRYAWLDPLGKDTRTARQRAT